MKKIVVILSFFLLTAPAFAYDCDAGFLYGSGGGIVIGQEHTYSLNVHNGSNHILNAVDVCRPDERWVFTARPGVSWDILNENEMVWGDPSQNCITFVNGEIGPGIDWGGEFYMKAIRPAPDNEAKWQVIVWQDYPNYIGNTWGYCDVENTRVTIRGYEVDPVVQSSVGDVLGSQVAVVFSIIPLALAIVGGLVVTLFGIKFLIGYFRRSIHGI